MNSTLTNLCDAYLDNGTGSVVLYYSFDSGSVGSIGSGPYTGVLRNQSPSFSVGSLDAISIRATGATALEAEDLIRVRIVDNSFDLTFDNLKYGGFSGISFLRPDDLDSEFVYLFSFKKTRNDNGVLFGSLVKESFDNGQVSFDYGKGFNIGINDRNKLFFQGSDSVVGDYVLTANSIELGDENICAAKISPYEVTFSNYNLIDDSFVQEYLRTDSKIQNNDWSESFYIGGSPTYLKSGNTFSGFIDNLMIISGNYNPSDLKAISSGFVATGIPSSGSSFLDEVVTGHSIQLFYQSGVTGYQPVITGYLSSNTEQTGLVQFVLSSTTGVSVIDGERFITGYTLPNNSGSYLEETSFLIKTNNYRPTGDDAFATLGLRDSGDFVETFTVISNKVVGFQTGVIPLYGLIPITGTLLGSPTGYLKTTLSTFIERTGNLVENLQFLPEYQNRYKKDYLYYLDKRL